MKHSKNLVAQHGGKELLSASQRRPGKPTKWTSIAKDNANRIKSGNKEQVQKRAQKENEKRTVGECG